MFEAILIHFWKVYWLRKKISMVSNFFWTDVHFTDHNGTDPKNRKMHVALHVALMTENILWSFKFLWRHVGNLQTRTCFQKLVCKIRFKQNDLKLCKLVKIDMINHLWKFHENRIHRSEVICWSVNYYLLSGTAKNRENAVIY